MANPKYIDETLLPDTADESSKKVTKKAYSFRCDETLLEDMNTYAELEGVSMPQLLSNIMDDFLADKTLTNTYLPEYEGQYISIPSNVDDKKIFEYELRYVMNNLDVWTGKYGYVSMYHESEKEMYDGLLHEGIDFVVIPETVHTSKVPDDVLMGGQVYNVDLNRIPSCLYCIHVTVNNCHHVDYKLISWIDAMNKLKSVKRYDIISYANGIKKRLDTLYDHYVNGLMYAEQDMVDYSTYGQLLKIAKDFNTGAILPASKSIDNIEYTAIVKQLPDNYDLINKIMKENKELKGMADELTAIKDIMSKVSSLSDDEILELFHKRNVEDLPESDDE